MSNRWPRLLKHPKQMVLQCNFLMKEEELAGRFLRFCAEMWAVAVLLDQEGCRTFLLLSSGSCCRRRAVIVGP